MLSKNKTLLLLLFLVFLIMAEVLFLFLSREGTNFVEKIKGNPIYLWVQKQKEVKIGDKYIGLSKYKIEELLSQEGNEKKYILPVYVDQNTRLETFKYSREEDKYFVLVKNSKSQILFSPTTSSLGFRIVISGEKTKTQYLLGNNGFILSFENSTETKTTDTEGNKFPIGTILATNLLKVVSKEYGEFDLNIYPSTNSKDKNPEEQLLRYKERIVVLNDEK